MKIIFSFIMLFFVVAAIISCECVNTTCNLSPQFTIIDKQTNEDLLTGTNPRYHMDSLMQKRPSDSLYSGFSDTFSIYRLHLLFNDTILLKLNSTDVDTVVVYYNKAKGDRRCCGGVFYEPQAVFYNGVSCSYQGNIFLFEK